jgi:hypothetical protein
MSALPSGMASAAASTVATLVKASDLKRSTRLQMFLMLAGLRHPAGDKTTRQPPPESVVSA